MTKVQLTFQLARPLQDSELVSISRMHSVYGFLVVRWKQGSNEVFVEYDASRLSAKEVRASLEQHGIPLSTPAAAKAPASEEPTAG